MIKYQENHKMTKGRAIQVVDDLNLRRVRQATRISSDLEYKGLKNKQPERTPEKCKEQSLNHLVCEFQIQEFAQNTAFSPFILHLGG
ncbi:unnamed protein product [Clavelina lepadiformis]|uniref:Uncharacterized protein n=1 Tax=Clavelina lepadiformis TaxID=159417 RepID=A0ABP0EY63_CLALP